MFTSFTVIMLFFVIYYAFLFFIRFLVGKDTIKREKMQIYLQFSEREYLRLLVGKDMEKRAKNKGNNDLFVERQTGTPFLPPIPNNHILPRPLLETPRKGQNIIRMSDGKVKKILVK